MPFAGVSPLKHFVNSGTQLHIQWPYTQFRAWPAANRHAITREQTHNSTHTWMSHLRPVTPQTHNTPHPWVMNNICLSVPPSLPLAWLLASSWLFCHNVILSAFLSAITKMCSDNLAFSTATLSSHQPGTSHCTLHRGPLKWCVVSSQSCTKYSQDLTWWLLSSIVKM